jgi:Lipocalin-like domain
MKKQATAFVMVAVFVFAGFGARSGVNAFARVRADSQEQLVGSWSLVSRVSTLSNGEVLPDRGLATTPKGLLIYDRTGHVAAQLSRQGRTVEMIGEECNEATKIRGTNDTAQTVLGYDAYFGTFTVNEKEGFVVHHLESALFPGDVGKDIKRNFTISGDKLTIKFNTTTADGKPVTRTLVWERMK